VRSPRKVKLLIPAMKDYSYLSKFMYRSVKFVAKIWIFEPLYDFLRKIALLKINEPHFELNQHNLTKRFARRKKAKVIFTRKG
jgi:hypothetical protein